MDQQPEPVKSSKISDRIAENANPVVAQYGGEFSWDATFTLLPTPQGPQAVGLFMMSVKNNILGATDIAVVEIMPDLLVLTDRDFVEQLVAKLVLRLRDARAKNLSLN